MPTHLLPRNSGAHRTAAIALYRALLTQCRALPPPEFNGQRRNELQNIVRNHFKRARHEQSSRRLTLNFEAGYEAIDRLDAAVAGDAASATYIVELLGKAPDKIKQTPPVVLPRHLDKEVQKRQRRARAAERVDGDGEGNPGRLSLFDRPLPLGLLTGKRHVPVLYSAQKIPVLRLRKPQPESLSGYLAHRVRLRQRRIDTRHRLEAELEIARAEDRWDGVVGVLAGGSGVSSAEGAGEGEGVGAAGGGGGGRGAGEGWKTEKKKEPAWSAAVSLARKEISGKLEEERRRNTEMAGRMQGVVDRERGVYEREKGEKEEARKAGWLAKLKGWKREKKMESAASHQRRLLDGKAEPLGRMEVGVRLVAAGD
ncbi:hypothetical protein LTR36_009097 [Oleoguttula mirabilis]|uniref:Complex 1 LYR protein domain-containing protein n=1 Tax=Oleoguttula mirabilis TaxID=1507867 RepID=A0AAV9J796_9PEZI|nr:hypothetical protein LTR36_009097 [Oleoguttula mirabilis]